MFTTTQLQETSEAATSLRPPGEVNHHASHMRSYTTLPDLVTNSEVFLSDFIQFEAESRTLNNRRAVCKAVVDQPTLSGVQASRLGQNLELVLPLDQILDPYDPLVNSFLVILAINQHDSPIPEFDQVEAYWAQNMEIQSPLELINLETGYRLSNTLTYQDFHTLRELWGNTFDWADEDILELITSNGINSNKWFACVRDQNNQIVSAAIAEKIELLGIPIIETTEWSTHPEHRNRGLIQAVNVALNAQILSNTLYADSRMPLITAECNTQTRSYKAARKFGMQPARDSKGSIGQSILKANVRVRDGKIPPREYIESFAPIGLEEPETLRNFLFMYMPREYILDHYPPEIIARILAAIESGNRGY